MNYSINQFLDELAALVSSIAVNKNWLRKLTSRISEKSWLTSVLLTTWADTTGSTLWRCREYQEPPFMPPTLSGLTGLRRSDTMTGLNFSRSIQADWMRKSIVISIFKSHLSFFEGRSYYSIVLVLGRLLIACLHLGCKPVQGLIVVSKIIGSRRGGACEQRSVLSWLRSSFSLFQYLFHSLHLGKLIFTKLEMFSLSRCSCHPPLATLDWAYSSISLRYILRPVIYLFKSASCI